MSVLWAPRRQARARGKPHAPHLHPPAPSQYTLLRSSEFFINLGDNAHLDSAYGGYCVFAAIAEGDAASWVAVDAVAKAIAKGGKKAVGVVRVELA